MDCYPTVVSTSLPRSAHDDETNSTPVLQDLVRLGALIAVAPGRQGIARTGGREHQQHRRKIRPLEIFGSLAEKSARVGENFQAYVTIANHTGHDLNNLVLSLDSRPELCFLGVVPAIQEPPEFPQPCVPAPISRALSSPLRNDQEASYLLRWRAEKSQNGLTVAPVVNWTSGSTSGSGALASSRVVRLGEISISEESFWTEYPTLLPLLAGAIGGILGWLIRSIFTALKDFTAEERKHSAATWNKMLPESHKLAMGHYVHIQAHASYASSEYEAYLHVKENTQDHKSRTLAHLVLFDRLVKYAKTTIGGLYLKNRTAEKILIQCLAQYRQCSFRKELKNQRKYERILEAIEVTTPVSDVESILSGLQKVPQKDGTSAPIDADTIRNFNDFKIYFDSWIEKEDCVKAINFVSAFGTILNFEMNRPYTYWYEAPDYLHLSTGEKITVESLGVMKESDLTADEVSQYLDNAQRLGTGTPKKNVMTLLGLRKQENPAIASKKIDPQQTSSGQTSVTGTKGGG